MPTKLISLFVFFLTPLTLFSAPPTTAPSITFQSNIPYGHTSNQDLLLDLARPASSPYPLPCILFIHGGAWAHGDKSSLTPAIRAIASQGYVAAAVNYRLIPAAIFPSQISDVKCAVRYLRSHAAQYNIDPDRIGALGDSAGGHLVLMLATTTPADHLDGDAGYPDTSSAVQAVVSWYGPTDLSAPDMPPISRPLIQAFLTPDSTPPADLVARASPIHYVHSDEPPILLLQGTSDTQVTYTQALLMAIRMTDLHAPGRVELLLNANHGFTGPTLQHVLDSSLSFFNEHLKSPQP
ncbi:MAG TPA: alpha/beta hydrolase [Tepidisphaeraceae bacterium]|nr:alpha/beta hydrolase [Tepidisphaeraceae bacterium]